MKLELKHLAPYLPYGLKIKNTVNKIVELTLSDAPYHFQKGFKPILRPLSDLIDAGLWRDLLRMVIERGVYKNSFAKGHESYKAKILIKPFGKMFKLSNHDDWVVMISFAEPDRVSTYIYNWLLENHFDVFGLIEKGLAIDKNTFIKWE